MKSFTEMCSQLDEGQMRRNEQEVYDAMSKVSGYLQEIDRTDIAEKLGKIAKIMRKSKNQHEVAELAKSI